MEPYGDAETQNIPRISFLSDCVFLKASYSVVKFVLPSKVWLNHKYLVGIFLNLECLFYFTLEDHFGG